MQQSDCRASGRPRRRENVGDGDYFGGRAGLVLGSWEGRMGRGGGNGDHVGSSAVKMTNDELWHLDLCSTSTQGYQN